MGGDAALGDHPGRVRRQCGLDDLDDGGGDGAGDGQAVVGVAAAHQRAAGEQQHIGGGERLDDPPADLGDVGVAPVGVQQGGNVQLGLHQATTFLRLGDLPARQADMRTDDHQPVPAGPTGRPDLRRGQRALGFEPGQSTGERRAAAVYERLAPLQRLQPAQDDDLQVGVVGGVDHDERAAGHPVQDIGDPVGAALADIGQRDGVDLVRGDRAAAFLGDEFPQVGRGVAEGGVLGELAIADRNRFPGHVGPMDVTGGKPAGLEVGGQPAAPRRIRCR